MLPSAAFDSGPVENLALLPLLIAGFPSAGIPTQAPIEHASQELASYRRSSLPQISLTVTVGVCPTFPSTGSAVTLSSSASNLGLRKISKLVRKEGRLHFKPLYHH